LAALERNIELLREDPVIAMKRLADEVAAGSETQIARRIEASAKDVARSILLMQEAPTIQAAVNGFDSASVGAVCGEFGRRITQKAIPYLAGGTGNGPFYRSILARGRMSAEERLLAITSLHRLAERMFRTQLLSRVTPDRVSRAYVFEFIEKCMTQVPFIADSVAQWWCEAATRVNVGRDFLEEVIVFCQNAASQNGQEQH
jgi:hypothetical protein